MGEKSYEFYKEFYVENRVRILQYNSLRENFHKMVDDILGKDYYNIAMDVYECDKQCCEDITLKVNSFRGTLWQKIANKLMRRTSR